MEMRLYQTSEPTGLPPTGLYITMVNYIEFTLTRVPGADGRPIACKWSPWKHLLATGSLFLLHERSPGHLERVNVGVLEGLDEDNACGAATMTKTSKYDFWDISASPGDKVKLRSRLTANYQTKLVPGQRYHLLWPGGELTIWDWGSLRDHEDHLPTSDDLGRKENSGLPRLVLLPAADVTFTAAEADEPFPDRGRFVMRDGPHYSYDHANTAEQRWRHLREMERRRGDLPGSGGSGDDCTWQPYD